MRNRIWLIGGTQESAEIAGAIAQLGWPFTVTVTTETARQLYPLSGQITVWVGVLNAATLDSFLQTEQIGAILDASHPYAVEISQRAIAAAQQYHIPYLRYERPPASPQPFSNGRIQTFDTVEDVLTRQILIGQRVLLTIGYRSLPQFQPWHPRTTLFARILPSPVALSTALRCGFTPDRLIAMRPPVSVELETALWQQWQISTVVTKASGHAGGETVKREVAATLGVTLVVLRRPPMQYPQQTHELDVVLQFCNSQLQHQNICTHSWIS